MSTFSLQRFLKYPGSSYYSFFFSFQKNGFGHWRNLVTFLLFHRESFIDLGHSCQPSVAPSAEA